LKHAENSLKIIGDDSFIRQIVTSDENGSASAILTKEINGWILTKWLNYSYKKGTVLKKGTIVHLVEF